MRFFNTHIGRCATLLALGSGIALYSQGTQTASATITVVDSNGAPVAGARVRMTSPSLMSERTGVTNSAGVFMARLLPPGAYTIDITRDGFQAARTTRQIGMDQHFQPRIVMQTVAGATVEVVATASSAVDPTSVQTSSNWEADRIDELPVGRGIVAVTLLTPGVTAGHGGNDVQIRGGQSSGNLFLVDGQNLMDNVFNSVGFSFVNDSFEETQVITGAISAEYGNVSGGVVNTLTKSGGNKFSGQYRVELSNDAWNATRPWTNFDRYGTMNPTTAQLGTPGTLPPRAVNRLSEQYSYTLGGFFIKDKLWFHLSILEVDAASAGTISSNSTNTGPTGRGSSWTQNRKDRNYIGKLSYLVNQDHTIIGTYSWNNTTLDNRNGTSWGLGEHAALQKYEGPTWMYNLAWRAIWSPVFNTEIRYGSKSLKLNSGAIGTADPTNPEGSSIRDVGYSLLYNAGTWRFGNPDTRTNQTANIKASYFANWYGTHELDFGFDYYKGMNESVNAQSSTDYTFYVYDFNGDDRSAIPWYMIHWRPAYDTEARSTSMGIYINDKWRLNQNWSFQIGVRWDNYKADADDFEGDIASSSGFSPRLGVTYDLFGDQQWIFKASYCRYNGAVIEAITGAVSGSGNPAYSYYLSQNYVDVYLSGSANIPVSTVRADASRRRANATDPTDYPYYYYQINPLYGTTINPDLKNPYADEFQIGATYSFVTQNYGRGYASLTWVTKKWGNMIDYSIGDNGWLPDLDFGADDYRDYAFIRHWDNQPLAKRDYEALEFVADWSWKNLHIGGNITWSTLEGNYEGEGANQPGLGQGLNNYRLWRLNDEDPVREMIRTEMYDPYGYLDFHTPLVMTWMADYAIESKLGRTVFGLLYTLNHGRQYSLTRPVSVTAPGVVIGGLNPDGSLRLNNPAGAQWLVASNYATSDDVWMYFFGNTITQFRDGQRTHGKFNTLVYHDLAITQDFNLFKVFDYQVRAFVKLQLRNVFNHQQLYSWTTGYRHEAVNDLDAPWIEGPVTASNPRRGTIQRANYGAARSVFLSAGIRF